MIPVRSLNEHAMPHEMFEAHKIMTIYDSTME